MERYLAEIIKEKPVIKVSQLNEWTKEKEVTIEGIEDCTIKYTIDGNEPGIEKGDTYKEKFKIDKTCVIKAIYIKEGKVYGTISEERITKIDKDAPETLEIRLTPSKKTIEVNILNVKDAIKTNESESSGISKIRARLSKDGETWTEYQSINKNTKTYTFDNIYGDLAGQKCTIQVEAIDEAGNIKLVEQSATTTCKKDNFYTNTKDELITTITGVGVFDITTPITRNYNKYNDEGAIAATYFFYNKSDNKIGATVILVGITQDSVRYIPNHENNIESYRNIVNYRGTDYFVSDDNYCIRMQSNSINTNFPILNSYENPYIMDWSASNHISEYDEVVFDMLDKYFDVQR